MAGSQPMPSVNLLYTHEELCVPTRYDTYTIDVAGVKRELRLFAIKPGLRIAILNILGDTELVEAAAKSLAPLISSHRPDFLVTPEAKAIPLAHALSLQLGIGYIVLRKTYKPYMGFALKSETLSITTGEPQTLYLDEKDRDTVKGKRVVLLDDVISTGSTLQGLRLIMDKADAKVVAEAAIFTEGDRAKWENIIALGHLPVFIDHD
jgi:adenine phosphoribosyltransferase